MIYFEDGFTGTYGENHPRICWNSATRRGTLSSDTEETGFEAVNAASPFEYNYWRPTVLTTEWLELLLPSAENIDCVCISSHNLGTVAALVSVQIPNGTGGWDTIGPSITPTDDEPICFLLSSRSLDNIRVRVKNMTDYPRIGVVYFGEALEFPQRTYVAQSTPANMARQTTFMNNETIGGKYVGRSIKRMRKRVDVPITHLTEAWVAANFDDFAEDQREYPYFLMPRPADYPKDIQYKWSSGDLIPERMGVGGNLMQVTV